MNQLSRVTVGFGLGILIGCSSAPATQDGARDNGGDNHYGQATPPAGTFKH